MSTTVNRKQHAISTWMRSRVAATLRAMKAQTKRTLEPAALIARGGGRVSIEMDEVDAKLVCLSLERTNILRTQVKGLLGIEIPETPVSDEREAALIKLLSTEPSA